MLLQMRTVLTAATWEVAFGKKLRWAQRGGLGLITCGCMAKQMSKGFYLGVASQVSGWSCGLLVMQIVSNVLAGVANELLLKQKGNVPLNLQNSIQYTWTLILSIATGLLCPLEGVRLNVLNLDQWSQMASANASEHYCAHKPWPCDIYNVKDAGFCLEGHRHCCG